MDIPDKKTQLTPKQEKFCLAYIQLGTPGEAYRVAFEPPNMSSASISVQASKLLATPKIALRIAELNAEAQAIHQITVGDLVNELEEARKVALSQEKPQTSAAVAATMGKAKLLGLEAPSKIDHSSTDGTMSPSATAVATEVLTKLNQAHGD